MDMSFHLSRCFQSVIATHVFATMGLKALGPLVMLLAASLTTEPLMRELRKEPSSAFASAQTVENMLFREFDYRVNRDRLPRRVSAPNDSILNNPIMTEIHEKGCRRRVFIEARVEFVDQPTHFAPRPENQIV